MKTLYSLTKCLVCCILLLGVNFNSVAQVAASLYSFTQSQGTYTALQNGTVINSGTADNLLYDIVMPTPFTYLGTPQTKVTISTNGHISFSNAIGNSVAISTYDIFGASLTNTGGAIAAFGADLNAYTASTIVHGTEGSEYVVQWNNYRRYNVVGDTVNMQIRLNISNGNIKIVYGNARSGAGASYQPGVGLRGLTTTDFNNRTVTSSGSWLSSTRGTATGDKCYFNSTNAGVIPSNGLTYLYEPPSCITVTNLASSDVTQTSASLSWNHSQTLPADGYEYYLSTSSTVPTDATVGVLTPTNSVALSNLTSSTTYYFWVRSICSSTDKSVWSAVRSFVTLCSPITTLPWTEGFESVAGTTSSFVAGLKPLCWAVTGKATVGSTSNSNVRTRTGTKALIYQFTTGLNSWAYTPGFTLTAGTSYRFTFYYANTNGSPFDSLKVAIGGSQDPLAMTQIGSVVRAITNVNFVKYTVDFTVPTNGDYNIGIYVKEASSAPWYLNIDDMRLEVSPTCVEPTQLVIAQIGETSAQLTWATPVIVPADGYEYYISTTNTAPIATTVGVAATASPVMLENLAATTTYYVWVRSICSSTDKSDWSAMSSFRTACGPTDVPYLMDFTTATVPALPECTAIQSVGTGNNWKTAVVSSNKMLLYSPHSTNAADSWFYTQGINLVAGTSYRISYVYRGSTTKSDKLKVAYGTSAIATAMTTVLNDHTAITNAAFQTTPVFADFTPTTSGVYYFGFEVYSIANQASLYVDDIAVNVSPSCIEPNGVTATGISATGVTLTWNAPASAPANGYEYYISTSSTAPTVATVGVLLAANTIDLTTLTANTNYYVWVRSLCDATTTSAWSGVTNFRTPCTTLDVPYFEGFEGVTTPAIPTCTVVQNIGYALAWKTATVAGNKELNIAMDYYAKNSWFYTEAINLTAGTSYRISYKYKGSSTYSEEKLKVAYGTSAVATEMTTILATHPSIVSTAYTTNTIDFIPTTTGVYYFGFHAYSNYDEGTLSLDNISITLSPSCLSVNGLGATNLTTTSVDLSWNASVSTPALGYEYYISTSNVAPTAATNGVGVTTTTASIIDLVVNTRQYVWVRSICSTTDKSEWSAVFTFTTPCDAVDVPYLQDFESATLPAVPSCTSVQNVGLGNQWITATIDGTKALKYEYNYEVANTWFYTGGINLVAGTSYRISYKYKGSTSYIESFKVAYGTAPDVAAMTTVLNDHPTVNNSAFQVNPVFVDFTPTTSGVYYFGYHAYSAANLLSLYVDDILIRVTPTCFPPTNVLIGQVTTTTADISWTAPTGVPGDGYEYIVSSSSTVPTATTIGVANATTSVTVADLNPSTPYYVWVRSVCSVTDKSEWTLVKQFTTPCLALTTLPWTENFDGVTAASGTFVSGVVPSCWVGTGKAGVMTSGSTYVIPRSPNKALAFQHTTGLNTWAYTPSFSLVAGQSYRYSFFYRNYNTTSFDTLKIAIGQGQTPQAMTTTLGVVRTINNVVYTEYIVDFTVPTAGDYNIGLYVTATTSPWYLSVDDMKLAFTPTCFPTTQITPSVVTASTATVTWTVPTPVPANGYEYFISTTNTAPTETSTGIANATNTVDLIDLLPATTYYVWVRSICSVTDKSTWSTVSQFTTQCSVITTLPWSENFESVTTATGTFVSGRMPACWLGTGKAGVVTTANSDVLAVSGTRSLTFQHTTSTNTWAFTPGFELVAGQSYRYSFSYRNARATTYDSLRISIGQGQTVAAMTQRVGTTIRGINNQAFIVHVVDFTVPVDGVYNLGMNASATSSPWYLSIDDVKLEITPCANPTAVISGGQGGCSVDLFTPAQIVLTGVAPWTLTLTDGTQTQQVIATTSPYQFHPSNGGSYTILEMRDATCAGTVSGTASFTYSPASTRTDNIVICDGDSYEFNGSVYTTPGTYYNPFQTASGCDSMVIVVLTTRDYLAQGSLVNGRLVATPVTGASYTWFNCATNQIVSLSANYTPTANGSYKVQVKVGNCSKTSACIDVLNLSVAQISAADIQLFPNPTLDKVLVTANGQVIDKITIMDAKGQRIAELEVNDVQAEVSLGKYSEGMYFLHIEASGSKVVKKVTKK